MRWLALNRGAQFKQPSALCLCDLERLTEALFKSIKRSGQITKLCRENTFSRAAICACWWLLRRTVEPAASNSDYPDEETQRSQ
jgi:hypothetical protein